MAGTFIFIPPTGGGAGGVTSVNGQTGVVTLTTTDIPEGTNQYYTDARARNAISSTAPIAYDNTTGVISEAKATGTVDGYLAATDFATFAAKEPAIAAGTTTQYWRGDKTFQTLNTAALLAVVSGTPQAAGKIGEIVTSTVAANTTTGVGASGAYGNVTSITLQAGAYVIEATAGLNENAATLTTGLQCGISDTADGSSINEFDTFLAPFLISSTSDAILHTPDVLVNISTPTTYYLNTKFTYTAGTPRHRGRIRATRIF